MADTKMNTNRKWYSDSLVTIFMLLVSIPLSMLFWVGNLAFTKLSYGSGEAIPPTRWLAATLIPLAFALWGYKRKSVNKSGAIAGLMLAFILTLASYAFLLDLVVFFVTSSQASKFKARSKKKIADEFREGAQRNWIQALCNAGVAVQLAVFYILESGSGERAVDFTQDFRSAWTSIGVLGAFACANADTWASELGTVLSGDKPFLITTGARVPKGTNGGVSWIGLLLSAVGGAVIGLSHMIALRLSYLPSPGPSQWPLIPYAAFAGLFGSIVDSLLGATVQYSGLDKKKGVVVETPGPDVEYISGCRILDNNSVNFFSTFISGTILPRIAIFFWPR